MKKIKLTDNKNKIIKQLKTMHEQDIVFLLRGLNEKEAKQLINLIPLEMLDDVFLQLLARETPSFFGHLDVKKQRFLISEISAADFREIFSELSQKEQDIFYSFLSDQKKLELDSLLTYGDEVAGSLMQNEFLSLKSDFTIPVAMKYITANVHDSDYIDKLFITDENNKLVGKVYLKDLIIARKTDSFNDLIIKDLIIINENEPISDVTVKISNYDLNVVPVVSNDNTLVGIISANEAFEKLALSHETSVDKFLAVGDYEEDSSSWKKASQRLPWLLVSIVLNLVIAVILSAFSNTLETVKALILFQPMILGMAGNIGMQSIGVTILKLHLDKNFTKEESKLHIKKEIYIALLNSFIVGIIGFFLSYIFLEIAGFDTSATLANSYIAIVISISLFLSMILSATFGVFIPLLLTKLKIDPAIASGPVISTINDLVALAIYFGMATLMILLIL